MGDKRKRSFDDSGDNHITKVFKTDNIFIANACDTDSQNSPAVNRSRNPYEFLECPHHAGTSRKFKTENLTGHSQRESPVKGNVIIKKEYPKADPPTMWYRAGKLVECPHQAGTLRKMKTENLTGYSQRESPVKGNVIIKKKYPKADQPIMWYRAGKLVKGPNRGGKKMNTKRESSFGETKNKSQANKHDIIRSDSTVSEPKYCSTLKELIDDLKNESSSVESEESSEKCPIEVPTFFSTAKCRSSEIIDDDDDSLTNVLAWNCDPTSSISYNWSVMDKKFPN